MWRAQEMLEMKIVNFHRFCLLKLYVRLEPELSWFTTYSMQRLLA